MTWTTATVAMAPKNAGGAPLSAMAQTTTATTTNAPTAIRITMSPCPDGAAERPAARAGRKTNATAVAATAIARVAGTSHHAVASATSAPTSHAPVTTVRATCQPW
jgi:hypothetical protein